MTTEEAIKALNKVANSADVPYRHLQDLWDVVKYLEAVRAREKEELAYYGITAEETR